MKMEYDKEVDACYISFMEDDDVKAAQTVEVTPHLFVDIDKEGRVIGIELLKASEIFGERIKIEIPLSL